MPSAVSRHYDALVVPTRAERASGPAVDLKRAHNTLKYDLIAKFARNANFLVDVGCGRGGDISKWRAAGVSNVLGIDISEEQVAEATRRALDAGAMGYVFETSYDDVVQTLADIPDGCADAVTSMFSLNYFFESRETAEGLFREIRRVLRPNGAFFGVYTSGNEVRKLYADPSARETAAYSVSAADGQLGPFPCFGDAYRFLLRDTVMDLDGTDAPPEFAVDESVLGELATSAGFARRDIPIGIRAPAFARIRDPDYARASSLYRSFAFGRVG